MSPIRWKIFNCNNFFSNLGVKTFVQDNTFLPCNCLGSGFRDRDHRHEVAKYLREVCKNHIRYLCVIVYLQKPEFLHPFNMFKGTGKFKGPCL